MDEKSLKHNIFLVGFSATGKSEIARKVAVLIGWDWFDMDIEISRFANKSIEDIFTQEGEERFRKLEREVLAIACNKNNVVIATGGGVMVNPDNRELIKNNGMVVCLEAKPEMIYRRLREDNKKGAPLRPLLAVPDPLGRIEELKQERAACYAWADWTVHTDNLSLEEVAREVVNGWQYWSRSSGGNGDSDAVAVVTTSTKRYPIFVEWGLLEKVGEKMVRAGLSGNVFIIADEIVADLYGSRMRGFLERAGFHAYMMALPSGETSKRLDNASRIYDFLVEHRAERSDTVIAFGGGVVGDMAGFAAATFLRGINLVQIPTTLVGMTDSSIGGKVAVDHSMGKNLIGAFYQPILVIADVQLLTTLPQKELTSGWAETIKHGLILDVDLLHILDTKADELLRLESDVSVGIVSRSVAIKADIVSEDEKETTGKRTLLNYGHTIGHGIEAATGYSQ